MKIKLNRFIQASILFFGIGLSGVGYAANCSGGTTTISTAQDIQTINQSDTCLVITSSGSIVPSVATSQLIGVESYDMMTPVTGVSITNNGVISYSLPNDYSALRVISSLEPDTIINSISNAGTISASTTGINTNASGIINDGTINTITNNGSIIATATGAGASAYGIYNDTNGVINTLNNGGTVSATSAAIYNNGLLQIC